MIYTYRHFATERENKKIQTDVCIVGSGAGGAAAAYEFSQAGYSVVVLEAGDFLLPRDFNQREDSMFPRLFYDSGSRRTQDRAIRVLHGKGVGGSTLHNLNLCKRPPEILIEKWGLQNFNATTFMPFVERVEKKLSVKEILPHELNQNNVLIKKGIESLGYRGGFLKHNRQGCVGSGFCELGCAFDAKLNALRVFLKEALEKNITIFANTLAIKLVYEDRKVKKILARVINPESYKAHAQLEISAKIFCCAAGSIETPLFLMRSEVPDPKHLIGSRLYLHPGGAVAGIFSKKVELWKGIPQSVECTEFLSFENPNKRIWIVAGSAHPVGAASFLPGFGSEHASLMASYPYMACLSAMVHDESCGSVKAKNGFYPVIDYKLTPSDQEQLNLGFKECAKILEKAGAEQVIEPFPNLSQNILSRPDETRSYHYPSPRLRVDARHVSAPVDLVSVHPMGSVWMGNDPKKSCLDGFGRYHHLDNLFVCDASVYPSSLGVPPQISTYAIGLYVATFAKQSL